MLGTKMLDTKMLDTRVFETLVTFISVRATVAFLLLSLVIKLYSILPSRPKFPEAELDENDWHGSLMRAKSKFQNKPFIFGTREKRIILPNYLFEELKDLPDHHLSFRQLVYRALNGKYTGLGTNVVPLSEAIKNELTMNINVTLAILQDEIRYAIEEGIGNCPIWTPVKLFEKNMRIVALASSRVFIGHPLCHDEEWIKLIISYTIDALHTVKEAQKIPFYLRPLLVPFLPSIRRVLGLRRKVAEMLKPRVIDIIEASKRAHIENDDNYVDCEPGDQNSLAAWSIKYYEKNVTPTARSVADNILAVTFATIHSTTMALTNVLYDLAAHPEYAEVLREEFERITAEEPGGKLRKKTMPKLRKLDSFIKESQRFTPLSSATLLRLVTTPNGIHLSSGDYLPWYSVIAVPQARHTGALDPKYLTPMPPQPSLDEFHPWRFSDLRSHPGEENKHQFVTTTSESTIFGHGRWACPGRFFAANEIKTIVIQLLTRYDIGVGPAGQGEGEGGDWKRPKTTGIEMGYYPDPNADIYFRDRKLRG